MEPDSIKSIGRPPSDPLNPGLDDLCSDLRAEGMDKVAGRISDLTIHGFLSGLIRETSLEDVVCSIAGMVPEGAGDGTPMLWAMEELRKLESGAAAKLFEGELSSSRSAS